MMVRGRDKRTEETEEASGSIWETAPLLSPHPMCIHWGDAGGVPTLLSPGATGGLSPTLEDILSQGFLDR